MQKEVAWREEGTKGLGFAHFPQYQNYFWLVICKCTCLIAIATKSSSRETLYAKVMSSNTMQATALHGNT